MRKGVDCFQRACAAAAMLVACLVAGAAPDAPTSTHDEQPARDIRYVIFHRPGPHWQAGSNMLEQPGVRAHVAYYRTWLEAGKLALGGPHLDSAGGGMMIPSAGVSEDDVRRFASADPAVLDGTLVAEVRPWLVGMRN